MQIPKLNVLIYPMFSVDVLNADSNYIIIKQLCNELVKTKKYNFFLLIDSNRKYIKDDLNSLVKIIKIPLPRSKKHQVIHFNSNIFRELYKKYAFDLVWNNVVEQGHHFRYFQDTIVSSFRTKVFNYHHYVIHRSLERLTNYLPCMHILYDQLVGSLGADINYFHSKHCYNMLLEEANDVLNDQKISLIKDKSILSLGGYVQDPGYNQDFKQPTKYEKFTFIYNHRLDGYKNWKDTFNLFDELYSEGYDFQVILTAGDKDNINVMNKKPYVLVKSFTKHNEYLKELSKCHCNTLNSIHETYCISVAESMVYDQVVVLPNRCTFPELVDKGYPYIFETIEEQKKILKKLISKNIKEYKHDKEKLCLTNHTKNIDNYFTELGKPEKTDIFNNIKKQATKDKIKILLSKKENISLTDFRRFVYSLGYASQSFPNLKLKQLLNELDYDYKINLDKFQKIYNE